MGAFIGYDDVGVWASNLERNAFLDWYAAHRCTEGDAKWAYCRSDAQRWAGCCIELSDLISRGEIFEVSFEEKAAAVAEFSPELAELLGIISRITRGEWNHLVSSKEAIQWRPGAAEREAKWQREQEELLRQPYRSSSFGVEGRVKFVSPDQPPPDVK